MKLIKITEKLNLLIIRTNNIIFKFVLIIVKKLRLLPFIVIFPYMSKVFKNDWVFGHPIFSLYMKDLNEPDQRRRSKYNPKNKRLGDYSPICYNCFIFNNDTCIYTPKFKYC